VAILRHLAGVDGAGEKLVDLAGALGLTHPTAHRILKALEAEGMVERAEGGTRYRLSTETTWLGVAPFNRVPITRVAAPHLAALSERLGEALVLCVPSHLDCVVVDRHAGPRLALLRHAGLGSRRPLGVGIAGRVILGFLGEARRSALLEANAARFQEWETDPALVASGAAEAHAQGYLVGESPVARDALVLALPVKDVVGKAIGAVALVAPRGTGFSRHLAGRIALLRGLVQDLSETLHQVRR